MFHITQLPIGSLFNLTWLEEPTERFILGHGLRKSEGGDESRELFLL